MFRFWHLELNQPHNSCHQQTNIEHYDFLSASRLRFGYIILNKVGNYETMTIGNVYRVFMKLVVRPKDHSEFGAYKCIANNTFGESEKVIHLHCKLILKRQNTRVLHLALSVWVTSIDIH